VPGDRDDKPVRTFRTFSGDLHRLADSLEKTGIKTVAMESTSVYWIPVFEILDDRTGDRYLVFPKTPRACASMTRRAPASARGRRAHAVEWHVQLPHNLGIL
jgi:hypothetical protein